MKCNNAYTQCKRITVGRVMKAKKERKREREREQKERNELQLQTKQDSLLTKREINTLRIRNVRQF